MGTFNIIEHYRNIAEYLYSQYELSSAYGHRGTKGQIREELLTETLAAMAPDDIKLSKGEICDSNGNRSPEFDIVISYKSTAIKLFASSINRVVPIETVLGIIEVKSLLSKDGINKFNSDLKFLNSFERYYIPTSLYSANGDIAGSEEYSDFLGQPVKASEALRGIGRITGGMFAFECPVKKETVLSWLNELNNEINFAFICVLNDFFAIFNPENDGWDLFELGKDSFAAFATTYIELADSNERENYVKCDNSIYIEYAATNIKEK